MARASPRKDREGLRPERRELAGRFLPLALSLARPYQRRWPHMRDEFESAATLALVEAAQDYNPSRGVPFPGFARRRVLGAMRGVQRGMVLRGWRGDKSTAANAPSLEPLPSSPEEEMRRFAGVHRHLRQDPFEYVDELESRLRVLPTRKKRICRDIYIGDHTITETARSMGLSQPRVSVLHREALERLARKPGETKCESWRPPEKRTPQRTPRRDRLKPT